MFGQFRQLMEGVIKDKDLFMLRHRGYCQTALRKLRLAVIPEQRNSSQVLKGYDAIIKNIEYSVENTQN